jgi:hypothetical protein
MASRSQNKQCPFFKAQCLQDNCAVYDSKLNNCSIPVLMMNLYKVEQAVLKVVAELPSENSPTESIPFPFTKR